MRSQKRSDGGIHLSWLLFALAFGLHLLWTCLAQFASNPEVRRISWFKHLAVLSFVPTVAAATFSISHESGLNMFTAACLSVVIGILLHQGMLVFLSPRYLVLWRLASSNLVRRKRNTALMILGLLVGSAMVSSSLVVGDSMDATIKAEILLRQDTSDIEIYGIDPITGTWSELNETRMRSLGDLLESDKSSKNLVDGFSVGRMRSVSVFNNASSLGEPDAAWWAMDPSLDAAGDWGLIGGESGISYSDIEAEELALGQPVFVANDVLADAIEAKQGDEVSITWSIRNQLGERSQRSETLVLWKVLETKAAGAVAGSKGGVLFSTLATAQSLQDAEGQVNLVRISALGGVDDSLESEAELFPHVERLLDEVLLAEDAGFFADGDSESGMISIGRSNSVGRLDGEMVRALRNYSIELGDEVSASELLQAPLISMRASNTPLTGLLQSETSGFIDGNSGRWYLHSGGVSFEPSNGRIQTWQMEEGSLLRAALLHQEGLLVAHDEGLSTLVTEDDAIEHDIPEGKVLGIAHSGEEIHLLIHGSDGTELYSSSDLNIWVAEELPADAISAEDGYLKYADEALIVHLKGLLEVETWISDDGQWQLLESGPHEVTALSSDGFSFSAKSLQRLDGTPAIALGLPDLDVESWDTDDVWLSDNSIWHYDGTSFNNTSVRPFESCDGAAFRLVADQLLCSTTYGVLVSDAGNHSIRIPMITELEGLGQIPLFVVAASGQVEGIPEASMEEVRFSAWLDEALEDEAEVTLVGFIAGSRGNHSGLTLQVGQAIPPLPTAPGQADLADVIVGVVNFSTAEVLSAAAEDERSLVVFSSQSYLETEVLNVSLASLTTWLDANADYEAAGLFVDRSKRDGILASEQASDSLAALFIVFGSFTMLAGMLLVVNIFVMVADERKNEMGMARALGMQRPDLRALFVLEGSLVAAVASALGSILGLLVGWLVATAFAWALSSVEGAFVHSWSWQSLVAGFAVGFLVSWASLWATSMRNSRLNVVAAMRNLPPQKGTGPAWWSWLLLLSLAGASVICAGWFFLSGSKDGSAHGLWSLTGIFALLALVPFLFHNLPHLLASRLPLAERLARHSARNTMAVLGISLVLWAMLPDWLDPVRADLEPNEFSFIIVGVSSVAAGVLLLTSLAPLLAGMIGRAASVTKRIGPVVPTALAYPLSAPFRTALTIGMFSLTVFSVVVLAGYSAQFESYSDSFVDDVSGDFDLLGTTSSWDRPLPFDGPSSEWQWPDEINTDKFDGMGVVSLSVIRYAASTDPAPMESEDAYYLRGIDPGFAEHGGLPLHIWDDSLGDDSQMAWAAISNNPNLCILDASFGMEFQGPGDENSPFMQQSFSIGESIIVIDSNNPSITRELVVIGFLDEGSLWSAPGIWVGHSVAEEFDARITRLYLSMPEGSDLEEKEDMAEELERGFIDAGMEVNVIETSVKEFQMVIFAIFDIFQSYLMLGLVVGIAGLGVVTVRAVSERSHQTGVLRALGFQRRMVVGGYLLELSWISMLGIFNGLAVGIGFHWYLYNRFWSGEGVQFTLPWQTLFWVVIFAWLLILLSTALPVRRAAQIHPAEALREISS
jgi:putative ABC transport system permease protein